VQSAAGVVGTKHKIDTVLIGTNRRYGDVMRGCVIVNERGLVIASMAEDQSMVTAMAAMTALIADTAHRAASNVGLSSPSSVVIRTPDGTYAVVEFTMRGRPFRVGALLKDQCNRTWFRRQLSPERIIEDLSTRVRRILEER